MQKDRMDPDALREYAQRVFSELSPEDQAAVIALAAAAASPPESPSAPEA